MAWVVSAIEADEKWWSNLPVAGEWTGKEAVVAWGLLEIMRGWVVDVASLGVEVILEATPLVPVVAVVAILRGVGRWNWEIGDGRCYGIEVEGDEEEKIEEIDPTAPEMKDPERDRANPGNHIPAPTSTTTRLPQMSALNILQILL